jgi:hypothetical protein
MLRVDQTDAFRETRLTDSNKPTRIPANSITSQVDHINKPRPIERHRRTGRS